MILDINQVEIPEQFTLMWGIFFSGEDYGLGPTSSTNVYISLVYRVTQRIDWECSFIDKGVDCGLADTTTYVKSM